MKGLKTKAKKLIEEFKGKNYAYGIGCLRKVGSITRPLGPKVFFITSLNKRDPEHYNNILNSFTDSGLEITAQTPSSRPNSPKEDVFRMKEAILAAKPDCIVTASGGSGIDAAKAAIVLACLGDDIERYFGVGKVSKRLKTLKGTLLPHIAVQTASGSSAHLTKYSNITDFKTLQKKLIIDEAVVPSRCVFDYSLTKSMSRDFTCDGAFDGLAHCLEVYYGANDESFNKIEEISLTGIELIIASLEKVIDKPYDIEAREAIGLGTDLGGYAIMIGGTNGAHLTSFSLVDILSHGRACAILNPYYTVFFAPAIQRQLKQLAELFAKYDLMKKDPSVLKEKELGPAVAEGMIALGRRVGFPATLSEIDGISNAHIKRALEGAKNPQLESKLKNMPVPLTADLVDEYMGTILEAAMTGDFNLIKTFMR